MAQTMHRRPRTHFPDFSGTFCYSFDCHASLPLPQDAIDALSRVCKPSKKGILVCDVEYPGSKAWVHIWASLRKSAKAQHRFVLGMHLLPEIGKKTSPARLVSMLAELARLQPEAWMHIHASFEFPRASFDPAVRLPDHAALEVPLPLPVKVVGVRLAFDADPVRSVTLDFGGAKTLLVSPLLNLSMAVSERLPEEILMKATAVAERFVVRKP